MIIGTAGHIDHGKTALVAALTGVMTDRLEEERRRGMSIVLGYAPLELPSGRRLSVVDVPGHERFVRTMVSGATGIDAFLMVVAADDGVMPQTVEHASVLRALGVRAGVVAVTKADVADPGRAVGEAASLLPGVPIVPCSSATGAGLDELRAALDAAVGAVPERAEAAGEPVLHVDRSFTVHGAGVVVTGTLWRGSLARGDQLVLLPGAAPVRVRGLHVHDRAVERAAAGQRVAVNLAGVRRGNVAPGDVLTVPGAMRETLVLDCSLTLRDASHGQAVRVHHGTREVGGRLAGLGEDLWQVRLEAPLLAQDGDRVVIRRPTPPDTLGGGVILDAGARRHGRRPDVLDRLRRMRDGVFEPPPAPAAAPAQPVPERAPVALGPEADRLEAMLRDAGPALLAPSAEGYDAVALAALREAGRAVRLRGELYGHPDAVEAVRAHVVDTIERDGDLTLARLRDQLGIARRSAQALLEHLDSARVTRRLPDDRRVLSRRLERERAGVP